MEKKTIIALLIILIGVAGLVWWSKTVEPEVQVDTSSKSHPARTVGSLVPSETFYDFGRISMKDGNVSKVFSVLNPTDGDINLEKLYTSCMCTSAYIVNADRTKKGPFGMPGHGGAVPKANEIVKAGESLGIEVVYDPNAHGPAGVGMIDRFVYLEDEGGNKIELEIKANVTP